MTTESYNLILIRTFYQPLSAFEELAGTDPTPFAIFMRYSVWLLLLPPTFALIGGLNFGWRVGGQEPLMLATAELITISVGYFLVLVFGLVSTAIISRWMAGTYGASTSFGKHLALITIVGEPLAVASIAHLFPDVLVQVLVLIPTMIWSMYLLYKGIPIALETPPERGMLMASSLVGWLLVAAVSLLGISMSLWTMGLGPNLGV